MFYDLINQTLLKLPIIGEWYYWNSAGLKRRYYLQLARWGRLRPIAFVIWLCTYKCNLHCPYCEASAGDSGIDELSDREAMDMLIDLKLAGVKRLLISGGEPLMRPGIIPLMHRMTELGIRPGLLSNGVLVESFWPELKKMKLFMYQTSLDGIPSYHDQVRGEAGAYKAAMASLDLAATGGVPIRNINTVVHPGNIDQLGAMLDDVRRSGATAWSLTPVAQVGRAAGGEFGLDHHQLIRMAEFITQNHALFPVELSESHSYLSCFSQTRLDRPFFCAAGLTRASIMPNGDVLGCNQVYDHSLAEGNIRTSPFSRLWKTGFQRFRSDPPPDLCRSCRFLSACQAGCWAEWNRRGVCMKDTWFTDEK